MTSRGCPWNCIYCFKSLFGRTMRFRSPENVIAELKWLKRKYNPRVIEIIDDLFTVNRKRTLEICQMIIDEGLDLKISTPNGIRVDTVDREVLLKMKEAGFFLVAFGLESGSQDILNKIGKGTTIDQGREAVRIAKEVGFEVMPSYQIGLPFDTPVTIDETINFAISNDTSYAQFFITTPYPGTRVRDYVLANGGTILVNDWSQYGHAQGKVFFEMPNLKKETVLKHYSKAYRKFYMRPKYIWRKAKDIRRLPQNFGMLFKYIGNFFGGADR